MGLHGTLQLTRIEQTTLIDSIKWTPSSSLLQTLQNSKLQVTQIKVEVITIVCCLQFQLNSQTDVFAGILQEGCKSSEYQEVKDLRNQRHGGR